MSTFNRSLFGAALLAAFSAMPLFAHAGLAEVEASLAAQAKHAPSELLVQFRASADASARAASLKAVAGHAASVVRAARSGSGELLRVRLPQGASVAAAARILAGHGAVEFAEPNWTYSAQGSTDPRVADDPYYTNGTTWGVYGANTANTPNEFGTGADAVWAKGNVCSNNVYVGLLDTGLMTTHADFAKNVWANQFDAAESTDEDGNGYVDDVNGWDFFNGDNTLFDGLVDAHGTQVAGIIGSQGGNGKGVPGMCWKVNMIGAKIMETGEGNADNAVKALDYLVDLVQRHGIKVSAVNASWGGAGYSDALKQAIQRAGDAGIVFVAAAGNGGDNIDTKPFYPASYKLPNMINVAAITKSGNLAGYSNWGPGTVDIGAPGSNIATANVAYKNGAYKSTYASMSGTSWAAAFVTGAVALYATNNVHATPAEIKAAIIAAAKPTTSLSGKVSSGGRLDVSGF